MQILASEINSLSLLVTFVSVQSAFYDLNAAKKKIKGLAFGALTPNRKQ